MIAWALSFGILCYAAALLMNLWRAIFAPTLPDRVLAVDTMVTNTIALLALMGIAEGTAGFFEAALLFALVGFISTVAFAKYLLRGNIIE